MLASLQPKRMWPYDIWSVGVLWLELLLGTPHVFQASAWGGARVMLWHVTTQHANFVHVAMSMLR